MQIAGGGRMRVEIARKSFGDTEILRDVEFEVAPAETVALVGPSGIGKSTILRIVAGLDRRYDGKVTGVGQLAMVFQEPTLLPWRSVAENLTLVTGCSAGRVRELLETVDLPQVADRFPNTLSLGQARRIALARAFAVRPDTLLLDEAFASLDRAFAEQMHRALLDLLDGSQTRVVMVTHDPREAARLATRSLRVGGTPATLTASIEIGGQPGRRSDSEIEDAARRIDRAVA